jgi:hypothetical protein
MLLFDDLRLFESIGSVAVFVAALAGVYLLARNYFGVPCAVLSVAIYGLSEFGLQVAGSLFARYPIQTFYIWMVYWTVQWVIQRRAGYLAAAVVTWAAGMYIYMEIAPAVLILPVVWLFYRPPIKLQSLLVGGLLAFAIWYPYLKFESARNFVDLRSQVLRQGLLPVSYKEVWCDPRLVLRNLEEMTNTTHSASEETSGTKESAWVEALQRGPIWTRGQVVVAGFMSNFEHAAKVPGINILLALLLLASLFVFGLSGVHTALMVDDRPFWNRWLSLFAVGMIVSGVIINEVIISRYLSVDGILEQATVLNIRWLQAVLLLSGTMLLIMRARVAALVSRAVATTAIKDQKIHPSVNVLVLALVIPWVSLLFIIEPDRTDRLWWLWPIQMIFLAASVTYLPAKLKMSRSVGQIASLFLLLMFCGNTLLLSRIAAWERYGWSGVESAEMEALNFLASQIRSQGKRRAAVGYQMTIWRFTAMLNVLDPEYKVGADFDFFLKNRHDVSNTNRCAEGLSPGDEFRIVETTPTWKDPAGKGYFDTTADGRYLPLKQFGPYQVLQRYSS